MLSDLIRHNVLIALSIWRGYEFLNLNIYTDISLGIFVVKCAFGFPLTGDITILTNSIYNTTNFPSIHFAVVYFTNLRNGTGACVVFWMPLVALGRC